MSDWVPVDPSATASDQELKRSVQVGVTYAESRSWNPPDRGSQRPAPHEVSELGL